MRVDIQQRTPEWHHFREGGVTASLAAALIGEHPHTTMHKIWLERTGKSPMQQITPAMSHGIEFEDEARAHHAAKTGKGTLPCCYQSDDYPFMRASLDGLNGTHVTEFKCPQLHTFQMIERTEVVPHYWVIQVVYQMLVSGAKTGELSIYNSWERTSIEFQVERNPAMEKRLIAGAKLLWDCLQNDTPPPLTDQDLPFLSLSIEDEYQQLLLDEDHIKQRKEQIKALMIEAANGKDCRTKLFTIKHSSRESTDWKACAQELDPDGVHARDFVKKTEFWTVRSLKRRG